MTKREELTEIADDTQRIFNSGGFEEEMNCCFENTKLYTPAHNFMNIGEEYNKHTKVNINVIESTSTIASYKMYDKFGKACVLNFASARKPGGGWKTGSIAQEESLARVSGLYYSLIKFNEIYKGEWSNGDYYQDYYIYSEYVPFIKDDNGILITTKPISVITSAAVNQSKFKLITKDIENKIEVVMKKRINEIFKIAIENNESNIILGAYGCGVFKNDSKKVASYFKDALDLYKNFFDNITFAIYDNTPNKEVLFNFKSIIL